MVSVYAWKDSSRVALAALVVLVEVLAPAIWKAMLPPKGPAALLLAIFMRQKFDMPEVASVPVQVSPLGTVTEKPCRVN